MHSNQRENIKSKKNRETQKVVRYYIYVKDKCFNQLDLKCMKFEIELDIFKIRCSLSEYKCMWEFAEQLMHIWSNHWPRKNISETQAPNGNEDLCSRRKRDNMDSHKQLWFLLLWQTPRPRSTWWESYLFQLTGYSASPKASAGTQGRNLKTGTKV